MTKSREDLEPAELPSLSLLPASSSEYFCSVLPFPLDVRFEVKIIKISLVELE